MGSPFLFGRFRAFSPNCSSVTAGRRQRQAPDHNLPDAKEPPNGSRRLLNIKEEEVGHGDGRDEGCHTGKHSASAEDANSSSAERGRASACACHGELALVDGVVGASKGRVRTDLGSVVEAIVSRREIIF